MNTCSLLLVAVVATAVVFTLAPSPATADRYLCPWRRVAHPDDPFIQNLGRWALEQEPYAMHFEKVESAKAQCVDDFTSKTRNYELIIDATIRPGPREGWKYRAVVYVINFTQPQKVISFEGIPPSPPPPAATNTAA